MKRSLQFPLHTESENAHRRGAWFVSASKTAKERAEVRLFLTQIDRPPLHLPDRPNEYVVTLTRIFVGELDDDNLRGALKGVRDEVAAWLGLDDRDRRVRWRYRQLGCERGRWAVRVEVEDLDVGSDVERVLGAAPRELRAPREQRLRGPGPGKRGKPRAVPETPLEQERLRFRVSYALLPWDQDGGDPVVTELPFDGDGGEPPESIQVDAPEGAIKLTRETGRARADLRPVGRVVLHRHRWRHRGADAWLYTVDLPQDAAEERSERR